MASESTLRPVSEDETSPTDGAVPEAGNPGGEGPDMSRVITSSGVAPTGGARVGGAADRIQPSRDARARGSATGEADGPVPGGAPPEVSTQVSDQ
jgi:hypothetical protein